MAKGKFEKWLEPEGLLLLESWARLGLIDEQIAHNMGISRSTLNEWKNRFPDISDALKKNKDVVDIQVENALLQKALGYSYVEETRELGFDARTGKRALVVTKTVTKHIAPDTTAAIFWLKNRRPDFWRDKHDMNLSGEVKTNPFEGLTTDELKRLIKAGDGN